MKDENFKKLKGHFRADRGGSAYMRQRSNSPGLHRILFRKRNHGAQNQYLGTDGRHIGELQQALLCPSRSRARTGKRIHFKQRFFHQAFIILPKICYDLAWYDIPFLQLFQVQGCQLNRCLPSQQCKYSDFYLLQHLYTIISEKMQSWLNRH